jgi:hypothetical protein
VTILRCTGFTDFSGLFQSSCIPKKHGVSETDPVSETSCFFGIQDDGKSPEKICEFCKTYIIVRILASQFNYYSVLIGTVKPVLNGISRAQNIFPLKQGFRLIKVYYNN